MWYLGVCEGSRGPVSASATGGTRTLLRRQANGHGHHLSLWPGTETSAVAASVPRKLRNSKQEPVRFFGMFMSAAVMGRGHSRSHGGETLHPNCPTAT